MSDSLITSRQNQRIKSAAKLRQRRARDEQGRTLVDGLREIQRALDAGIQPVEAFVCSQLLEGPDAQRTLENLTAAASEVFPVTPEVFEKIAFGDRAEGIVAVISTPQTAVEDLRLPESPLVAVIEGVEKPGNLGAVLRSADATGVNALVVADGRTDLFNPATIRASLGTVFSVPVCCATSVKCREWLRTLDIPVFAATPEGAVDYTQVDLSHGAAMVLGSEATGLSDVWTADDIEAVRLPMRGIADSLNVSAAAAVLFYEARRQRGS